MTTADHPPEAAEITIFEKSSGILSKKIALAADGSLVSDGSACRMSSGVATRVELADGANGLAALIERMPSNQALSLGRLVSSVGASRNGHNGSTFVVRV